MAALTAYDQLLLEVVNRSRMDPLGEAARLGIDLNAGLAPGTITASPKQPLAPNGNLVAAARGHSQHMLNSNQFNHQGIGDGTPTSRMQAAGYALTGSWATGENIAWVGTTGTLNMLTATLSIADNLFRSAGHRANTLYDSFRELGTGVVSGPFKSGSTTYNSVMATENFGLSGSKVFVSGVAINDLNSNNFYDIGEARGSVAVTVSTGGIADGKGITEAAGGYAVAVNAGTHAVTFSGAGLAAPVTVSVDGGTSNVKVDLSGTNKILSSATTALGAGAKDLVLLGAFNASGTGNAQDNVITGNKGNNTLVGGDGNDTLSGGNGIDVLRGDAGRDVLTGGAGADTFVFRSVLDTSKIVTTRDVITDFVHGTDKIDVAGIDANSANGTLVNDVFKFLSLQGAAFTAAGQLHFRFEDLAGTANDKTIIEGDINGDRVADFQLELRGLISLTAVDFVL